ncbi:AAA family ATPase [Vibrio vulnificus]|nr:AAA family ATPase [Vibrio vulnificus]
MKEATIKDGWRRVNQKETYSLRLNSLSLENVKGFDDAFNLIFSSGLTAICGKNGVGKSTLLKIIFDKVNNRPLAGKVTETSSINLSFTKNGVDINEVISSEIYYIDPSFECSRILTFISSTANFEEFLEGIEVNDFLNRGKILKSVSSCIGKPYKRIDIYEIENAIDEEYTFPYFQIELNDGTKYDSLNMGMGEHLCMFILWYVEWIESNSILLIEELENYLAAYSQRKLLDYLAYKLSEKKIWTVLTTHSEHILDLIGVRSTRVLYRKGYKSLSVSPQSSEKYLRALGLSSSKKGVYFVEDYFAALKFKLIVNNLYPELLDTRDIIGLRCDSNMEKVIKHYQPASKPFFDLMAVFDADQHAKISGLINKDVVAICLPSSGKNNPEEEIWNTLENSTSEVANLLNVGEDRLSEEIESFRLDDHHDRYYSIARAINLTFEQLVSSIITQWMKADDNMLLAKKFMVALLLRDKKVNLEETIEVISSLGIDSVTDEVSNKFACQNANEAIIYFDGVDINILKIN